MDQVYEPIFSKFIYGCIKFYKTGTIINNFMDRKTMDKIGNWGPFSSAEDWELYGRALSKHIKVRFLPINLFKNVVVKGSRERRYYTNQLNGIKRRYSIVKDRIMALGFHRLKDVFGVRTSGTIAAKLAYIQLKILNKRTYSYSDYRSNEEYFHANMDFLDPEKFGIPKEYWVWNVALRPISLDTINKILDALFRLGFNRVKLGSNRHLIVFTDRTKQDIVKFYYSFWKNFIL